MTVTVQTEMCLYVLMRRMRRELSKQWGNGDGYGDGLDTLHMLMKLA